VPVPWDFEKLRAWRETAGLTRERVCADTGISYPWLRALEGGTDPRRPSLATLTTLARYYGHEPGELLTDPTAPARASA
jgi:transcriptional regulator with XRE-family HTH domain